MWTVAQYVAWALTTLLSAFIGSYLAGYLKKKGENLATHEDINKLVAQVTAVTEATKKIEADISIGVWDKQKRWEMKREVLFEAAKRLSAVENAMIALAIVMKEDHAKMAWLGPLPSPEAQLAWEKTKYDAVTRWDTASAALHETALFVGIVCREHAQKAIEDLRLFLAVLAGLVLIPRAPEIYDNARSNLIDKIRAARNAIRKELEVDA